jgi:hypothetical protein
MLRPRLLAASTYGGLGGTYAVTGGVVHELPGKAGPK